MESLAIYKFLSYGQMVQLGVGKSSNSLSRVMGDLTHAKNFGNGSLVGQHKFAYHPKLGKVEDIFYLKLKGKNWLIKEA